MFQINGNLDIWIRFLSFLKSVFSKHPKLDNVHWTCPIPFNDKVVEEYGRLFLSFSSKAHCSWIWWNKSTHCNWGKTLKKLRIVAVRLLFKATMQVLAFDSEQECLVHMLLHNFTEKRFPPDFATNWSLACVERGGSWIHTRPLLYVASLEDQRGLDQ